MKRLLIICAVILVLPHLAFAQPFPDTGQTTCYDDVGNEITPCPQPGEDFYGQDANYAPYNPQSYTKLDVNGNDLPDDAPMWVMVRDNVTGLIWEVKTEDGSIHDKDNEYDWYDAQDVCIATINSQNFCGYNDWRMPTVEELFTIVNSSITTLAHPTINTDYFPNTQTSGYWSSTESATPYPPSTYARTVSFNSGNVWTRAKSYGRINYDYVRAVRAGQPVLLDNFFDNGDGTVADLSTGLMWQKDTAPSEYIWQEALSYCENLTLAGYDDWRLPNINELHSLVDYSKYSPTINTDYFPMPPRDSSPWSSTTYPKNPSRAYGLGFKSAFMNSYEKGAFVMFGTIYYVYSNVRAVRTGLSASLGDWDGDGVPDTQDNCPTKDNEDQADSDGDGLGDVCDNCPEDYNPGQEDNDQDGSGNVCDPDDDNDGICDPGESDQSCEGVDNCPDIANPFQEDIDGDGTGDMCEPPPSEEAIPTLSEWGMIIFMTIILGIGVVTLVRRRVV